MRQLPKWISFVDIAREEMIDAVCKLNSKPRKYLNYVTPYKVFKELIGVDAMIFIKGIRLESNPPIANNKMRSQALVCKIVKCSTGVGGSIPPLCRE